MKIINKISELNKEIDNLKSQGKSIALVPTMGYLHEGHESLIKRAVSENDCVIVSIFVNPTQFGEGEDYESYPRDINRDSIICEENGVDIIFNPSDEEMYPRDFSTFVNPSEKMTSILCAVSRPIHFRGVCTILTKLFSIIRPVRAYFGEKDIQQLAIVKKMVKDLNLGVEIIGCPIIREEDGLAKSSRNTYLSEEERKDAVVLRKSLLMAKKMIENGEENSNVIKNKIIETINGVKSSKVDYVEILDFESFDRIKKIKENTLIAMAVYIGKTRLIDNIVI